MRLILLFFLFISAVYAEVAKVSAIVGDAKVIRGDSNFIVKLGTVLEKRDIVITQRNSKVQIIFKDQTIVTIGKNSALDISDYVYDTNNPKNSKTDLNFFKGAFKAITGNIGKINKEKFKLRTKGATIGIRGTIVLGNQQYVACTSGEIIVSSNGVTVNVPKNQYTQTQEGEPPSQAEDMSGEFLASLEGGLEPDGDENSNTNEQSNNNESDESNKTSNDDENKSEGNNSTSNDENETQENQESSENEARQESNSNETESTEDTSSQTSDSSTENSTSSENQNDTAEQNSFESSSLSTEEETSASQSSPQVAADTQTLSIVENTDTIVSNTVENTNSSNTTDTVNEASENQIVEYNLTGMYFGGILATSNKFIQQDRQFSGKRVDKTLSFDRDIQRSDGVAVKLVGEESFSSFDTAGNYTGFSSASKGSIPFSYTSPNFSGNYEIYTDNVGEVFIGFNSTFIPANGDMGNYFFILGNQTNPSNLNSNKLYVYKDFKEVKVGKDDTGVINSTGNSSDPGFIIYNPLTNSLTHFSKEFYEKGATDITIGNSQGAVSYYNNYDYTYVIPPSTYGLNLTSVKTSQTDASLKFLGSQYQAVAYNLSTSSKTVNSGAVTNSSQEGVGASLLMNNNYSSNKSGSDKLDGFVAWSAFGASAYQTDRNSYISLTLDRDNKTIKTFGSLQLSENSTTYGQLRMDASVANNNAYYISDDIFGAMFATNSDYVYSGTNYDIVSNSGYLISVIDGKVVGDTLSAEHKLYDTNDNPFMSDDESSWGYWTAKFINGANEIFIDPNSAWVAGVRTDSNYVLNNYTSSTLSPKKLYFKGKALGSVTLANGTIEPIIVTDAVNKVNLVFNLGGGINNMEGSTMEFQSKTTQWNLGMTSTTVNESSFSGNLTGTGVTSGGYKGYYYGTDNIKSVGGSFDVAKGGNKALGVFKASKWKEE